MCKYKYYLKTDNRLCFIKYIYSSMKFSFHSHVRMINIAAMEQYALTISAVWLAVSKIPIARMMNPVWMVNVFHLQNAQAMQTAEVDKYVMTKESVQIATMIQTVIMNKNVLMVLVKMQDVAMIETA